MAGKINEIAEKTAKSLLTAGLKKAFPSLNIVTGTVADEIICAVRKEMEKTAFKRNYDETINRLYPGKYEMITSCVEKISGEKDLCQVLIDSEFNFEKAADAMIEESLSLQINKDFDDEDRTGIKTGLIFIIGKTYENLCSLKDEDVKKWLVEQTVKTGHAVEIQDSEIKDLKDSFKQQSVRFRNLWNELFDILNDHENRIGNLENNRFMRSKDCYPDFKELFNEPLFLENSKKDGEEKKKLSDVYFVPFATAFGCTDQQPIDEILPDKEKSFALILGQPGIGKSSFITAYLNGKFREPEQNCSVFQFADFYDKSFWNEHTGEKTANLFLREIGIECAKDLSDRTIFLDGFDEIHMDTDVRVCFLSAIADMQKDRRAKNSRIFVTCRTNYIEREALKEAEFSILEIQPFTDKQLEAFCKTYRADRQNRRKRIQDTTIRKLQERRDIYGLPVLLYIVLVTRVYEENAKNTVEIYKKIFSNLYSRSWGSLNEGHKLTSGKECKKYFNKLAQAIAVYMFEHGDAAEGCPRGVIETIGEELKNQLGISSEVPDLIGGFYKINLVEKSDTVFFVHRTIYEYFFTDYLAETVKEYMNDINSEWFMEKFCRAIRYRRLSKEMIQYFFDHSDGQTETIIATIKINLEKALDRERLSTETGFLKRCQYEWQILSNCLIFLSKHYVENGYWRLNSGNFVYYLKNISQECSGLTLPRYDFQYASLSGANLQYSHLELANLNKTCLEKADLTCAHLYGAHLEGVNLYNANLREAFLRGAHLENAYLFGANMDGANLCGAHLEGADLRFANALGNNMRNRRLYEHGFRTADEVCWNLLEGAVIDKKTHLPKDFSVAGRGMLARLEDDRIKDIDSGRIIGYMDKDGKMYITDSFGLRQKKSNLI